MKELYVFTAGIVIALMILYVSTCLRETCPKNVFKPLELDVPEHTSLKTKATI